MTTEVTRLDPDPVPGSVTPGLEGSAVVGLMIPGMSPPLLDAAAQTVAISQYGSTRSLNAGVASGIAMYAWALRHAVSDRHR